MEKITSAAELKLAIQQLEFEQTIKGKLLKDELVNTIEGLKPINILRSSLAQITSSPHMMDNMLGSIVGLLSGYVTNKMAIGSSHSLFRKIMGSVMQYGVKKVVVGHTTTLKAIGSTLLHLFSRKN